LRARILSPEWASKSKAAHWLSFFELRGKKKIDVLFFARPQTVCHVQRTCFRKSGFFGAVSFAEEVERVALQHPRADRKKIVGSKNYVSASTVPEKVGMAERS